jgi:hypothetical protein
MCDDFNPLNLLGGIADAFGMGGESKKGKKHEQQFGKAAQEFEQYKQELRPVTMQGLKQQMGAYQPALGMLEQMYGPQAQFDIEALLQDPREQVLPQIQESQQQQQQQWQEQAEREAVSGLPKAYQEKLLKKLNKKKGGK